MFMLLMLTGSTRFRPKMNRTSGGLAPRVKLKPLGLPSSAPSAGAEQALLLGIDHQLQRGDLRRDAELLGDGVALIQLVGGIEPDVEADRLLLHRDDLLLLQIEQVLGLAWTWRRVRVGVVVAIAVLPGGAGPAAADSARRTSGCGCGSAAAG